jgi:hypothetical protein
MQVVHPVDEPGFYILMWLFPMLIAGGMVMVIAILYCIVCFYIGYLEFKDWAIQEMIYLYRPKQNSQVQDVKKVSYTVATAA